MLNALFERGSIDPAAIEDVIMGCVGQVGEQSLRIGRNAVLASRLPETVPAVSIDRQCGSSRQAMQFAAQAVMSGTQDVVIAAGVESMTRVPMFASAKGGEGPYSARVKQRFGVDGFSQFVGAEMVAEKHDLSRERLDAFAPESHRRAAQATQARAFDAEIVPVSGTDGVPHHADEGIRRDATAEGIAGVQPLREGGRITAANASQICDGASAVLIASGEAVKRHGLKPLARIHNVSVTAGDPVIMLEDPITVTRRALERSGLKLADLDLYEVNEAFASVPLAWLGALEADPDKLNVNGGAIALGHPLGATGTKLMATLVHALHARDKRWGLQTMCEGGGIANVTIVEAP